VWNPIYCINYAGGSALVELVSIQLVRVLRIN
jgi:hypothetical protein